MKKDRARCASSISPRSKAGHIARFVAANRSLRELPKNSGTTSCTGSRTTVSIRSNSNTASAGTAYRVAGVQGSGRTVPELARSCRWFCPNFFFGRADGQPPGPLLLPNFCACSFRSHLCHVLLVLLEAFLNYCAWQFERQEAETATRAASTRKRTVARIGSVSRSLLYARDFREDRERQAQGRAVSTVSTYGRYSLNPEWDSMTQLQPFSLSPQQSAAPKQPAAPKQSGAPQQSAAVPRSGTVQKPEASRSEYADMWSDRTMLQSFAAPDSATANLRGVGRGAASRAPARRDAVLPVGVASDAPTQPAVPAAPASPDGFHLWDDETADQATWEQLSSAWDERAQIHVMTPELRAFLRRRTSPRMILGQVLFGMCAFALGYWVATL